MIPSEAWSLSNSPKAREKLVQFWLHAPSDQLESIWKSPIGYTTSSLIKCLDSNFDFTPDQIATRNALGSFLSSNGLNHPLSAQIMIANFLLSPPGLLTVNNIDQFFPVWLCNAYKELYQSSGGMSSMNPSQSLQNQVHASQISSTSNVNPEKQIEDLKPDFGPFPETLDELLSNRIHLNRILGLSNLFYIDPDDAEIRDELLEVRRSLSRLILSASESTLEQIWSTEFGDRYWSLVRSGIQSVDLPSSDESIRSHVVNSLNPDQGGGFGTDGAINSFLVAMMYFIPGSMRVDDAESKLPSWLFPHYQQIFQSALSKN